MLISELLQADVKHLQSGLKVYSSLVLLQKAMQETVGRNKCDSAELKTQNKKKRELFMPVVCLYHT